jgi:hypothetical protein
LRREGALQFSPVVADTSSKFSHVAIPSELTNNEGANISKAFLLSHCFAVKARELKPAPIILSPK